MLSQIKKHYHWAIAVVMLLQLAVIGGVANNYSGLFILPITSELQINRATFSLVYMLKYFFSFIIILSSGAIFHRIGNKKAILLGLLCVAAGYTLLPMSNNVVLLAMGNIFLGSGEALCSTAAVSHFIGTWFHRYKGLVWGVVSASTGVGGSAICVLLSEVITRGSWRLAYFLCSGMVALIFLLVLLLVRSRPEDMGLTPYGMGYIPAKDTKGKTALPWAGYTMTELKRTPVFYFALISVFIASFAIYLPYDIVVPHLQDQGLSQQQAIAQQSAMLIYLTISKLVAGFLSDWFGSKSVTIGCVCLGAVSLFLFAQAADPLTAAAAVLFYALALPVPTVLIPLLTGRLFGYQAQGHYHGIFMAAPLLALLIASPIANAVYDHTRSYSPVLLISAGLCIASAVLFAITYILSLRDKTCAANTGL